MKNQILAVSLAAGSFLVAAPAMAQTSGHVGASYSRVDAGGGDADGYGIDGAVTIPTGGSWAILLDGAFSDSDDSDSETLAGTFHLITRNENHAFGGYAGLADVSDQTAYVLGGEYAKFFNGSTLALGLGYGNIDDVDVDLYGLNGEYRIFANDNLRFDLGAGLMRAEASGSDADVVTLGAGVEYRFSGSPISLGAAYTHVDIDDFGVDGDVFGVTLRWNFGQDSLKTRDRTGNTFGTFGGFGSAVSLF